MLYFFGLKINPDTVAGLIGESGPWAPVVFILFMTATFIAAPISGTPLFFAGYLLFDNMFLVYNYLSMAISMVINFYIARKWGRNLVIKFVGLANIEKVDHFTKDYGLKALIFLRIFQGQFQDFISYAYGLTKIKFTPYIIVSLLGPIPWTLAWRYLIFPKVDNFAQLTVWYGFSLVPFLVLSWFIFRKTRDNVI